MKGIHTLGYSNGYQMMVPHRVHWFAAVPRVQFEKHVAFVLSLNYVFVTLSHHRLIECRMSADDLTKELSRDTKKKELPNQFCNFAKRLILLIKLKRNVAAATAATKRQAEKKQNEDLLNVNASNSIISW